MSKKADTEAAETTKRVRLQVMVDEQIAAKIDELAELLNASQSAVAARLLEEGIRDNEWIVRRIVAPLRKGLDRMFGGSQSEVKHARKG